MTIEKIVRPFESVNVAPPTRVAVPAGTMVVGNVVRVIGKGGSVRTFEANYSTTKTVYMEQVHREHGESPSRGVHKKRIKNPKDDTQYVDVDVIDWVRMRGPNGQVWKMIFAKSPEVERGPDDPSVTAAP